MTDDTTNVITFRPRAGDPPGPPPLPPIPGAAVPPPLPPSPSSAPAPDPVPDAGADVVPGRARQSAAGSLADVLTAPAPLPPLPPQRTDDVPATFRSEGLPDSPGPQGPGLGALSLSSILAVALAALRGTVTVVSDWRQRRMDRAAEEAVWREAKVKRRAAEEDARAKLASVPTSAAFGRKAVQDGRKAASGPSASSGGGRPGQRGSAAHGSMSGPSKKPSPTSSSKSTAPTRGPDKPRPVDQPRAKTSDRTKPLASPKDRKGGSSPGGTTSGPKGGAGKALEKPGKASSGVLSPSKGKTPGGPGKGLLDRARDRKGSGPGGSGKGGVGKALDTAKPGAGRGRTTSPDRKTGGSSGSTPPRKDSHGPKPGPTPPTPRKVPGARHGTPEAYDDKKCRCRRCVRYASKARRRKDRPGGPTSPGTVPPRPTTPPWGAAGGPPPGAGAPPPRGARRSADEDLHTATAYTETVITVERADRPGDQARRWEEPTPAGAVTTGAPGLPRAPEQPAGPRPGTTGTTSTTKESPMADVPARATSPGGWRLAPTGDAAEHLTEVTLDDVLDHLAASRTRCFATYDECADLSGQARKLRNALEELAHELAERHNVIGRLTSAAMGRLAETMEVVARKAEEMRTRSLEAAENVESVHDAMHDAYRPVQTAAASAGLAMPSARIHNED
ncbi:hypothetical protein RJT17_00125 (plasmid) [Streptomyces sp. P5-A9]|uniref:hypothetical protein n=1 Tax=Streptomyces sp. P5-A9 TaxID=3071730 RepID=UPI002FCCAC07